MCGRYLIDENDAKMAEMASEAKKNLNLNVQNPAFSADKIKTYGEVFPTDIVPVMTEKGSFAMKWGFVGYGGRIFINARSETANALPTFRDSVNQRRCVIPASAYFEWSKAKSGKIKHKIAAKENRLFLAACYRYERTFKTDSFVILTTEAAENIKTIHGRMPLIINENMLNDWFADEFSPANWVSDIRLELFPLMVG